ncbi:MAG: hypothetical protein ACR2K2_14660 [Mycobacteriales bacterium]
MTTTAQKPSTAEPFLTRRRRGALALIAGALVEGVLVQQGIIEFFWTPLILGLTYLVAATAAGRKGALWAPGIVVTCWGVAVVLGVKQVLTFDASLSYYVAAAIGVAIALVLRYAVGLAAGPVGLVVSVAVVVAHAIPNLPSWIFQGLTWGIVLGIWGLWELRPSPAAKEPSSPATAPEHEQAAELPGGASASSARL